MVGRRPLKEQDQEAVELIEKLKQKQGFKTDIELASWLGVQQNHISRWKKQGIPGYVQVLIKAII